MPEANTRCLPFSDSGGFVDSSKGGKTVAGSSGCWESKVSSQRAIYAIVARNQRALGLVGAGSGGG